MTKIAGRRTTTFGTKGEPMSELIATLDEVLPPPQAVHLDQVCDRFESAWKSAGASGPGPRIEEFLGDTREVGRSVLLRQLLLLELDYRRMPGEDPAPAEYGPR